MTDNVKKKKSLISKKRYARTSTQGTERDKRRAISNPQQRMMDGYHFLSLYFPSLLAAAPLLHLAALAPRPGTCLPLGGFPFTFLWKFGEKIPTLYVHTLHSPSYRYTHTHTHMCVSVSICLFIYAYM